VNLLRQSKCTEHVGEVRVDRRRVWTRTVRVAADDETVRCGADDGQELCQFVVETTDGSTRRSVDVGDGETSCVPCADVPVRNYSLTQPYNTDYDA